MYSQEVQRSFFQTCSTPVLTYEPKPARYGSHGESKRNSSTPLLLFTLGGRKNVANLNELCSKCSKGFTAESSGHKIGTRKLFMQPSNANNSITQMKSYAPRCTIFESRNEWPQVLIIQPHEKLQSFHNKSNFTSLIVIFLTRPS